MSALKIGSEAYSTLNWICCDSQSTRPLPFHPITIREPFPKYSSRGSYSVNVDCKIDVFKGWPATGASRPFPPATPHPMNLCSYPCIHARNESDWTFEPQITVTTRLLR